MTISNSNSSASASVQSQSGMPPMWFPTNGLGWKPQRRVVYIHRHPMLQDACLYFWNHQENAPEAAQAQRMVFLLEDIYCEARGEFAAQKLVLDVNLGSDGQQRLISGLNTTCAATLLSSLCSLSSELLRAPLCLKLRPGQSHGVVMASLFVENEWVDGRALRYGEKGEVIPIQALLIEVQTLLRLALAVELLPHQRRLAKQQSS